MEIDKEKISNILDNYRISYHSLQALWLESGGSQNVYFPAIDEHFSRVSELRTTFNELGLEEDRLKAERTVDQLFQDRHPEEGFDLEEVEGWVSMKRLERS